MEEVKIRISSVGYEVEASLFTDGEELFGEPVPMEENQPRAMEISLFGHMEEKDGRVEITYAEDDSTGLEGSTTAISYAQNDSGIVTMIREGAVSTALVFEAGKRHHSVYNTPYMPFTVCVHTLTVSNRIDTDGVLELDYIVEIRGAQAERTKFKLELL